MAVQMATVCVSSVDSRSTALVQTEISQFVLDGLLRRLCAAFRALRG